MECYQLRHSFPSTKKLIWRCLFWDVEPWSLLRSLPVFQRCLPPVIRPVRPSETDDLYKTTQHNFRGDCYLHTCCHENLKSHSAFKVSLEFQGQSSWLLSCCPDGTVFPQVIFSPCALTLYFVKNFHFFSVIFTYVSCVQLVQHC
jgi:hypothetical protein